MVVAADGGTSPACCAAQSSWRHTGVASSPNFTAEWAFNESVGHSDPNSGCTTPPPRTSSTRSALTSEFIM